MLHIQLHNLLFLLTLFPGIILFFTNIIPIINKKSIFFRYLICLFLTIIINGVFLQEIFILNTILLVVITPFILFFIEYVILERKISKLVYIYKNNKIIIQSIFYFPILEEIIFRYFVYQYCVVFEYNYLQYILLSTFSFIIAHIFYQGISSIIKGIFSFSLNLIFIFTLNIFVTILIHTIFNFFVYLMKINSYNRYKKW